MSKGNDPERRLNVVPKIDYLRKVPHNHSESPLWHGGMTHIIDHGIEWPTQVWIMQKITQDNIEKKIRLF